MSKDFDLALDLYSIMTQKLPLYADWLEVENVLLWRDEIDDNLEAGAVLTDEQARALSEADDRLLAQHDRLARDFPQAFDHTKDVGPRLWWWHLPEGPEVREKAKTAA